MADQHNKGEWVTYYRVRGWFGTPVLAQYERRLPSGRHRVRPVMDTGAGFHMAERCVAVIEVSACTAFDLERLRAQFPQHLARAGGGA